MIRRSTRLKADSRGSALADAMVGVLVAAVALLGLSTMAVATSTAVSVTTNNTDRVSFLRSYTNTLALNPLAVPHIEAATTSTQQVDGSPSPVTIWRVSSAASTTIHAAMSRWTTTKPTDCSAPAAAPDAPGCLTAQATVTAAGGAISTKEFPTNFSNPAVKTPAGAQLAPGTIATVQTKSPGGQASQVVAQQAQNDLHLAYADVVGRTPTQLLNGVLGAQTLTPGTYKAASSLAISNVLTLDGQGNPNAQFIFLAGSTIITASNTEIRLINGAQAGNVYWQVGSSATLGTFTKFVGTIMAYTSITVTTGCRLDGRALAMGAAVTLDTDVFVNSPFSAPPPGGSPRPVQLGSAIDFSVLGAATVTNTGDTKLVGLYGVYPGTATTGFPPSSGGTPLEVRYVLRVRNATADGSIVFTSTDSGTVIATIPFTAGQDGYFYGATKSSTPVDVSLIGASALVSHVYFYRPPA